MSAGTLKKHGGENWHERARTVASERTAQAKQWCLVTGAARLVDVTEGAVRHAIARGDLAAYEAADGTRLVYVPDVLQRWPSAQSRCSAVDHDGGAGALAEAE